MQLRAYVANEGFSVARDFTGHGIGKEIHEEPVIFHFGKQGQGPEPTRRDGNYD